MARNIEIKARIPSIEAVASLAAPIADEGPVEIAQDDTFFTCPNGRLKLRCFADRHGELIYYQRSDQAGPKESFYLRTRIDTPDVLRESLALAWGIGGRVIKQRLLYLVGQTRIHLDDVQGLGSFLELEVVLRDDQSVQDGEREAQRIMQLLQIAPSQLVEVAYVDLLREKAGAAR